MYTIRSYVQSNAGELTDYQIIKQQQERNKELAKLRQTPEFKKRDRDGMIKLQDNIEHAKNACPHCHNFRLRVYSDVNPSPAYIESTGATLGVTSILIKEYGENPALHAHIAREHPKIIEQLKQKLQIIKTYRDKSYGQKFLAARIPEPRGDKKTRCRSRAAAPTVCNVNSI
jgi:hypothetical protein